MQTPEVVINSKSISFGFYKKKRLAIIECNNMLIFLLLLGITFSPFSHGSSSVKYRNEYFTVPVSPIDSSSNSIEECKDGISQDFPSSNYDRSDIIVDGAIQYDGKEIATTAFAPKRNYCNINMPIVLDEIETEATNLKYSRRSSSIFRQISEGYFKIHDLLGNVVSLYLHFLGAYELLTKSFTSGFIGLIGDFCAQCFEYRSSTSRQGGPASPFSLDRIRLFAICFESTLVSGPLMHYAYNYMEYLVPIHDDTDKNTSSVNKWTAASFHVLADFVILGPIFVFTMMLLTSLIEGQIRYFWTELGRDFGPALCASTVASLTFVPIQLFAFRLLPLRYRLLYMNLQDVIWNAVVSIMAHKNRK